MQRFAILIFLAACGPKAAPATTPAEEEETAPEEADPAEEGAEAIESDEDYYACVDECVAGGNDEESCNAVCGGDISEEDLEESAEDDVD